MALEGTYGNKYPEGDTLELPLIVTDWTDLEMGIVGRNSPGFKFYSQYLEV